jgi:hypothetical protein
VSGTAVTVDGDTVGTTDANGTVEFTVPVTRSATVAASVTGIQGATQLTGLYRNAIGVVVGLAIVIGGLVWYARRRGITRETVRTLVVAAGRRLARLPGRVTGAMIRLAKRVETAVRSLSRRLRSWPALLSASLSDILMRLDPRRAIRAIIAWLQNQAQAIRDRGSDAASQESDSESATTAEQRTIRSLWGSFVTLVRPPSLSTRTPVEISQYAIDSGLPSQPVEYLTALYRAVEYGRESPDASRLDSARDALSEIQDGEDEE